MLRAYINVKIKEIYLIYRRKFHVLYRKEHELQKRGQVALQAEWKREMKSQTT